MLCEIKNRLFFCPCMCTLQIILILCTHTCRNIEYYDFQKHIISSHHNNIFTHTCHEFRLERITSWSYRHVQAQLIFNRQHRYTSYYYCSRQVLFTIYFFIIITCMTRAFYNHFIRYYYNLCERSLIIVLWSLLSGYIIKNEKKNDF